MSNDEQKHLEFIQNIITRMNTNSFQIKGMTITLVTGLLAVYTVKADVKFIFLSIAPTVIFWCLNGYYLQQERKFRGLYNDLVSPSPPYVINVYEMPIGNYKGGSYNYLNAVFSRTLLLMYLPIIGSLITFGSIISIWYTK